MRTKSKFKVGDKVKRVPINAETYGNSYLYNRIKFDRTYTVKKITIYGGLDEGMDIVCLDGFHRDEQCWAKRFVKVGKNNSPVKHT